MPAPWVPDSQLLADVARFLGMDDPAELAGRWSYICTKANAQAQGELTGILAEKGYSAGTIAAWDFRREYVLELGTYLAVTKGQPDKAEEAKPLDRRAELREATVIITGGVPVGPASPADTDVGGISFGTATTTRDALLEDAYARGYFPRL
jgi:hypothetical protein